MIVFFIRGLKMNVIKGDLIALAQGGHFDIIIHGCNCFCTMGSGIARSIRETFPTAFSADLDTKKGDKKKLGDFSQTIVICNNHPLTIINGYTQFKYHGPLPLVDYDAVRRLFRKLQQTYSGKRFGYPKIGAGLAGGDWSRIKKIINEELAGEDHTLVIFTP